MIDALVLLAAFAQIVLPPIQPAPPPPDAIPRSVPALSPPPGPMAPLLIDLPRIEPGTPLKDLLPLAPALARAAVYTGDDLSRVPELRLEATPGKELTSDEWRKRKAHAAAAALHLNAKEEDGYLKAVLKDRPDLAGVPFVMGGACRTKGVRTGMFKKSASVFSSRPDLLTSNFASLVNEELAAAKGVEYEQTIDTMIAAVRQITGPADATNGKRAANFFAGVPRAEATRELARMAVFSTHEAVRKAALEALSVRRERDYTEVLVAALRYPWPAVARNAAEAIVVLDRKDLMPTLVEVLDEPDPRGPVTAGGKATARELVRVNHHRNCVMCHAPARAGAVKDDVLVAEVPVPSEPLQPPSRGYGSTGSNLLVRIDVTYLRQDFSVMQEVDEKSAWPSMQRFDFVVRKRELTAAEADGLRGRLEKREAGVLSPYHQAAVTALRAMTGRDFEAKAEPWRRHLMRKSS